MATILSSFSATLCLSVGAFILTTILVVTRYRSPGKVSTDCKRCLSCGREIYGLCSHFSHEQGWCRCLWR